MTMRCAQGTLAALAMIAALTVSAQEKWYQWDVDFDEDKKPWKEIEAKIPSYPRSEALLAFEGGGASPHRFFIDSRSLSIGEDGVVRYTLVIKTAGGATNVSFEGIRCEMRQQKVYAVGQADGSWARARNPQWRRILIQGVNRHHGVLFQDYLCEGKSRKSPASSVKEVLQQLRYGTTAPSE